MDPQDNQFDTDTGADRAHSTAEQYGSRQPRVDPVPPTEVEPATSPSSVPVVPASRSHPTGDPQPGAQRPIGKKRRRLMIGITMSLISLVVIGAALAYVLWWQNPEKMIADGVASVIRANTVASNTALTMKYEQGVATIKINTTNKKDASRVTIDLNVTIKDADPITLKLDGIFTDNGTLYVKVEGMKEATENVLRQLLSSQAAPAVTPDSSVHEQVDPGLTQEQIRQIIGKSDLIIKEIDSRWIKIRLSDSVELSSDAGKVQQCLGEALKRFGSDTSMRKEIAQAYRDSPFMIARKDIVVESYDGATGFELDMSNKAADAAKAFGERVARSKVARDIKACNKSAGSSDSDASGPSASGDNGETSRVRIWVTPLTHQLKRIEIVTKSNTSSNPIGLSEVTVTSDFELNKPQVVEVPKDSVSAIKLQKELRDAIQSMLDASSQYRQSDFDYST